MSSHHKMDLTFSERLELVMRERCLYPSDVERLTGIRKRKIYEYLQGTHQPSAYAVKRIALGLDVSSDYLLGIKNSAIKGTHKLVK